MPATQRSADDNGPIGLRARPTAAAGGAPAVHPSSIIPYPSHYPSVCLPSLLGGAVLSYVCAAVFLGMGVVAAWLWGLAGDPANSPGTPFSAPARTAANSAPRSVGKITAMSNCQWLDPQTAAREGEPVPQGRSYALTSGLLEIAYDAGARAIVEGPAIFTVDAANGGSLFCGKLTMQVGKLDRARWKTAKRPKIIPRPLTPRHFSSGPIPRSYTTAAPVETKFGVEVDRSWVTYMHVFRGGVVIQSPGFKPCPVGAGTCVWTGAARSITASLFSGRRPPLIFVQEMPKRRRSA